MPAAARIAAPALTTTDRTGRSSRSLDLAVDSELGPRPDPLPATPDPAFAAIGARLVGRPRRDAADHACRLRLLDPSGVVIAGAQRGRPSFGDVEEVRAALAGSYASVLRQRVPDRPAPPLYSVSRGTGVRVFVALPVVVDGRVAGAVYLSRTPNNIVKHLYGERGKVVLAAIAILGAHPADRLRLRCAPISRPMHELIARTQAHRGRRPRGDTAARPPRHARDGRAVRRLPRHGAKSCRRARTRIQTFATHVSHELKSPLTAIQGAAELLRDAGDDDGRGRAHALLRQHHRRCRPAQPAGAPPDRAGARRKLAPERRDHDRSREALATAARRRQAGGPRRATAPSSRLRMSPENAAIVLANLSTIRPGMARRTFRSRSAARGGEASRSPSATTAPAFRRSNRARIFEPFFTTGATAAAPAWASASCGAPEGA